MDQDLQVEIERLKRENEKLKATQASNQELRFKVSPKGAVSVYGMGRFPVTLYKEQWLRLFERIDDLKTFIEQNNAQLTVKGN